MPSGCAVTKPNRTPLLTRSARTSWPLARACLTASARSPWRSAVISRASSSTSPAPISATVCRSLENEGSVEFELRALEALRDEGVGDEVAAAALDRIVVAAEAGIGVRAAGAGEGGIDAELALGRHDRLGRLRPPGPVLGGELGLEQRLAARDQVGDRRRPRRGDGVEIEVRREHSLVPARAGRGARADQQRQRRDGADGLRSHRHFVLPRFRPARPAPAFFGRRSSSARDARRIVSPSGRVVTQMHVDANTLLSGVDRRAVGERREKQIDAGRDDAGEMVFAPRRERRSGGVTAVAEAIAALLDLLDRRRALAVAAIERSLDGRRADARRCRQIDPRSPDPSPAAPPLRYVYQPFALEFNSQRRAGAPFSLFRWR